MSISPSDSNLALLHLDQQNEIQRKLDMDGLKKRLEAAPDKAVKLREACEGFESIFIQKMWEQMRKNVEKSGYLHSRDEQMYQGMYDMEFSKKLTQAGGIGLADMLYEQLAQRLGESSRGTSTRNDPRLPIIPSGSSVSGLGPEPKPLETARPEAGIPLDNRRIKPLRPDAPALYAPAAPLPVQEEFPELAPFDDEIMAEQEQEQADLLAEQEQDEAADLDFEAISRELLQKELEAERITEAQAPLSSAINRNGTNFATGVAKSAENAETDTRNSLPRS